MPRFAVFSVLLRVVSWLRFLWRVWHRLRKVCVSDGAPDVVSCRLVSGAGVLNSGLVRVLVTLSITWLVLFVVTVFMLIVNLDVSCSSILVEMGWRPPLTRSRQGSDMFSWLVNRCRARLRWSCALCSVVLVQTPRAVTVGFPSR